MKITQIIDRGPEAQRMQEVFVAKHPTEAHLIAGFLTSQGIPAEIRGEALFGARGEVPVSPATLPSVWVEDERVDEARAILASGPLAEPDAATQRWTCANCGEAVEPHFSICWNCGQPAR